MRIYGLQKTTLLDYPAHLAATIFTGGCNFYCPYCHNEELIHPDTVPPYTEEEVLDFLRKRKDVLEGVCITGGEPTLQKDLAVFIEKVRGLGYKIKLDTNGYRPEVLKTLLEEGTLDYVAMDVKGAPSAYEKTVGLAQMDFSKIRESLTILKNSGVLFECRTTVVKGLHTKEDFEEMGEFLRGVEKHYIQNYKDSPQVLCKGHFQPFSSEELAQILNVFLKKGVPSRLRGEDG